MKKVLIVAVHPDDESLGCGGTLLHHKARGDSIHWLILTKPTANYGFSSSYAAHKQEVIQRVADAYGFDSVQQLGLPATGLSDLRECDLVQSLSTVINDLQPEVVYVPFHSDVHGDHKVAFQALMSATKSFRYPSIKRILMIETISETDQVISNPAASFTPNVYVDITSHVEEKLKIIALYDTEIKDAPFPRSIDSVRALSCYRGAAIEVMHAESFMLLREKIV